MNWRRGLFRLWILVSLVWIGVGTFLTWEVVRDALVLSLTKITVPVDCKLARGAEGVDYEKEERGPWSDYRLDPSVTLCWYSIPKFRAIIPEYKDLTDGQLIHASYAKHGMASPKWADWPAAGRAIAFTLLPPLALLAAACALIWALLGFARRE